jgi:predicted ATP-binding protein involved in virulence
MIRIDNLKLHNFRCFEDCEVAFEPDLTVFVARNGQGKTAILDGVALALGLFVDTISGTNNWRGFQKRDVRRIRQGTAPSRRMDSFCLKPRRRSMSKTSRGGAG